ncbi:transglutaminase domain-containing protein [Paenibacillus amylolyticus]|uniref:Transglutaminase domain-containing protein n=1 Tax=Paenibacillus amylolyticus TaxID=1451 RepID=A0A5M9WMJ4_PAEAM|nr:transglutaminaseTgpA domain-containing protein [Paenibacillus amylolyticus]KAA8782749.1 transglutaminase domain-containing protein [Paenibacillus amylolyticus]
MNAIRNESLGLKRSWYHAASLLWIFLIALQWISFTQESWYTETTSLVLWTLAAVSILEVILPFKMLYRTITKAVVLLYILHKTLIDYMVYIPYGTLTERMEQFILHMPPYIWFTLCAWVMLEAALRLVNSTRRILVFLGINIISLGILDSFTQIPLWVEIAWVMFAGMGWLVCQHFRNYQLQYPQGWKRMIRYPYKILANIAIIFSLIIVASVNMPEIPPTLTDPYTAWRNYTGTSSSQSGNGVLDIPTATESGYSREDSQLGGGFNFDYTPVMSITTSDRSYWRGETRSEYTGTGWDEPGRASMENVSASQTLENEEAGKVNTKKVTQKVTMLNDTVYPILFGAYSISQVSSVNGEERADRMLWNTERAELHVVTSRQQPQYPKNYTVVSEVPIIVEDELRTKSADTLYTSNPADDKYLQLPSRFPERVKDLAAEVTASAKTPYEKVALLQDYLQQNFNYTNNPDLSRKVSNDFVEGFLFDIREGYCDYFSTALVMMARAEGIPARWVKGYAPGQMSLNSDMQAPRQPGAPIETTYTVTNADAHSWAEVYFGEYGWIPVEATPGFDMPLLTEAPEVQPADQPEDQPEEEPVQEEEQAPAPEQTTAAIPTFVIWIAVAVIVLWVAYMFWRNRLSLRFLLLRLRTGRPLTPEQKVLAETERWIRYARRRGLTRSGDETLRESVTRWSQLIPSAQGTLEELLMKFEQTRYSPATVTADDWKVVYQAALKLRKELKAERA